MPKCAAEAASDGKFLPSGLVIRFKPPTLPRPHMPTALAIWAEELPLGPFVLQNIGEPN
jgi:hypothetical protein